MLTIVTGFLLMQRLLELISTGTSVHMDVLKQCEAAFFISVSFSCVARGSHCEAGLLSNDNQAQDSL